MKYLPQFIISSALMLMSVIATAQLRLPSLLSSGMVMQQNDSAALWGWGGPSEKVYVTTSWNKHTDSTTVTNMATWKLKVKTPAAGGPHVITIRSRNTITLTDVWIGEVWVCSGQSNMEWSYNNGTKDIRSEVAQAYNPNIRFFHIDKKASVYPQDDVQASWQVCDSTTIKSFSSVGYFFGKKLQSQLNVPIGLINASWGGTPAETWTPDEVVKADAALKNAAAKLGTYPWWPSASGQAYNGMIAPLTNYNIAGAIWYQGESNTTTYNTYQHLFTSMIESWRTAWKKNFPFYYVQIAPYTYGTENIGALLQEAQTKSMSHPKTGMVVISDFVDTVTDIHPSRKKPVGDRLANWALADTYGKQGIAYKHPQFASLARNKDKLVLTFSNIGSGLISSGKSVEGFYVSAANEKWYPANATIEKDQIIVWCEQVKEPVHVRYAFSNTAIGNIRSKEGLPLIAFRTDNW